MVEILDFLDSGFRHKENENPAAARTWLQGIYDAMWRIIESAQGTWETVSANAARKRAREVALDYRRRDPRGANDN